MRSTNGHDPELALRLGKDIEGRVIAPDDAEYDEARTRSTAGSTSGLRRSSASRATRTSPA